MSTEYEYWLFDLDGTLVDVSPSYAQTVIHAVGDEIGYQFSELQIEQLWHGLGGTPDYLLNRWGINGSTFWDAFHAIESAKERAEATFLYPDAEAVGAIESPVGLVTHCQPYLTKPVLEHLDIADWFDTIVCCDDTLGWKPEPKPVQVARSNLAIAPGATGVMIGDSSGDIGAAWNAGIEGIHVERHGHNRRGCCIRADEVVSRIDEIRDVRHAPTTQHISTAPIDTPAFGE